MPIKLPQPETAQSEEPKTRRAIDLRSDTVTQPTPEMRRAMAEAEVGDDVYGEDPTVNRLQERAAQIFEREAAIFVPSGTMGNQIAVKCHTHHGQEIICEERAHFINLESATMAAFSGCLPRTIQGEDFHCRTSAPTVVGVNSPGPGAADSGAGDKRGSALIVMLSCRILRADPLPPGRCRQAG